VFRIGVNGLRGVLGALPPHLISRADREKVIAIEDMYLDIGASSREEAERHVAVGDYACFDTTYEQWGSTRKGKAFDDRVGCTVLASLDLSEGVEVYSMFNYGKTKVKQQVAPSGVFGSSSVMYSA